MTPVPHLDKQTDRTSSAEEDLPAWEFWLRRNTWKAKTLLQKKRILIEDRLGLYPYRHWIKAVEQPRLRGQLKTARTGVCPPVGFVIAGGQGGPEEFGRTVQSLQQFGSLRWTLFFLLPDASPLRRASWFQNLLSSDARLEVVDCGASFNPSDWYLHASRLRGDWLVPLAAGDQLSFAWAGLFCLTVEQNPSAEIIYWDEDRITPAGVRSRPFFKPDWSPALLVSTNYLETCAFRKDLLLHCNQNIHVSPAGWIFTVTSQAAQIEHIASVLHHRPAPPEKVLPRTAEDHAERVRAGLTALGYKDVTVKAGPGGHLRVSWRADSPMVSVIIPTKNNLRYLERCLASFLEKTAYPDFEIILIDDHSTDQDVLNFYEKIKANEPRIRIFPNEMPFNYSRVNNFGARQAKGRLLLFLNNDTEILQEEWLSEMVRWVQLPGVGMAGAKLLYPDRKVQHAGIVLGMTGHANHIYAGGCLPDGGMFLSPDMYRDVSAVTGACMLVRKNVFEQVGGFNEDLKLVFNDVELCQKVRQAGCRIVYVPSAILLHHEGRSRSRFNPPGDIRLGADLLADEIERGDRCYNANLSLAVNWPTLRRPFEPEAVKRLRDIVRFTTRSE